MILIFNPFNIHAKAGWQYLWLETSGTSSSLEYAMRQIFKAISLLSFIFMS